MSSTTYIGPIDHLTSSLSVAANVSASDSVYDLPVAVVGLTVVSISSQLISRMSACVGYLKDLDGSCGCRKVISTSSDSGIVFSTQPSHQCPSYQYRKNLSKSGNSQLVSLPEWRVSHFHHQLQV